MTTVYCTAYGCKYYKPHDEDYGICEKDSITLDESVCLVFEGCPEYKEEGRIVKMSWYSDDERFNEHDDPYCIWKSKATNGKCGQTKAECDRCMKEYERIRYCDVYQCEECPRYGDDCDGRGEE